MALDLFPTLIGQGFIAEKVPMWSTAVAGAASGRERRQKRWSYPKWRFRVGFEVLRSMASARDLEALWAFFNKQAGCYSEWAFKDPNDYAVSAQAFGFGDGTTKSFQLLRTMSSGGFTFTEPVRAVIGVPTVMVAGVANTSWTIDDNGILTFTSAPANGAALLWTGQFAFHVRFEDDELGASQMMSQLWSASGVGFVSIKR